MSVSMAEYVQNTAAYIEENIKRSLSLEQISEDVGVSKFYLNRIFSGITGQTLMAYVNRRKLVSSLHELQYTKMHIVDISEEYGFSFESAFIRSFKREFGVTPDTFRRTKCELSTTTPITEGILAAINDDSILVKPVIMFKPAFCVTGDRRHFRFVDDVSDSFMRYFNWRRRALIKNVIEPNVFYGHSSYDSEPDMYWFTCGVQTGSEGAPEEIPQGMVTVQIPANNYLVFRFIKNTDIRRILNAEGDHIYEAAWKWIDITGYEKTPYSFLKVDLSKLTESYFEMDLYFPIVEKKIRKIEVLDIL
jgi:AraC family transcriptional regulator